MLKYKNRNENSTIVTQIPFFLLLLYSRIIQYKSSMALSLSGFGSSSGVMMEGGATWLEGPPPAFSRCYEKRPEKYKKKTVI